MVRRRIYNRIVMIFIFFLLYSYQGLMLGLNEAYRLILKSNKVSDGDIAWLGISSSPFYLKFIIAPVMDTKFYRKIGKRFSWIIPTTIFICTLMYVFAEKTEEWLEQNKSYNLFLMNFALFLFIATQDVAIDGMVCEVLNPEDYEKGALMQTLGQSVGPMIACNVFILLISKEFAASSLNRENALITISGFIRFLAIYIFVCTVVAYFAINEKNMVTVEGDDSDLPHELSLKELLGLIPRMFTDVNIRKVLVMPALFEAFILFTDACAYLKLIEKGFKLVFLNKFDLYFFIIDITVIFVLGRVNILENVWKYYKISIDVLYVNSFVFWLVYYLMPKDGYENTWIFYMIVYKIIRYMTTVKFTTSFVYVQWIADKSCGGSYLTIVASCFNFFRLNISSFLLKCTSFIPFIVVLVIVLVYDGVFRGVWREKFIRYYSDSKPEVFLLQKKKQVEVENGQKEKDGSSGVELKEIATVK